MLNVMNDNKSYLRAKRSTSLYQVFLKLLLKDGVGERGRKQVRVQRELYCAEYDTAVVQYCSRNARLM